MTIQTNAFSAYDAVGNREDLTDYIYNISPRDTPFITSIGKGKAKAILHEWQTDSLAAATSDNAQLEGDVVTGTASSATTRQQNYCQISRKDVVVTGTQEVVDKAGRVSEMAYQTAKRGAELLRDMETIVAGNQGYVVGTTTLARKLRSLESWLSTNTSRNTAATATAGQSATIATAGATDASAQRAFSETILKDVVSQVYVSGGSPTTIMVGPINKQNVSAFTGRTSARQNVKDPVILGAASLYMSDFGDLKVIPNRFQRERSAFVLDPEYVAISYLRPIHRRDLAVTGDSDRKFMLAEYTLEMRNEAAHGVAADLTTTVTT